MVNFITFVLSLFGHYVLYFYQGVPVIVNQLSIFVSLSCITVMSTDATFLTGQALVDESKLGTLLAQPSYELTSF